MNKDNCVQYLVDRCLEVHLVIPDVVLGQFAQKFK